MVAAVVLENGTTVFSMATPIAYVDEEVVLTVELRLDVENRGLV